MNIVLYILEENNMKLMFLNSIFEFQSDFFTIFTSISLKYFELHKYIYDCLAIAKIYCAV